MPELSYLSIEHQPYKTYYREGDRFEKNGIRVVAHYDDGSSSVVPNFTYSPTSGLTPSINFITIYFGGESITQQVTVDPRPQTGYYTDKYLKGSEVIGENPRVNAADGSFHFSCSPIVCAGGPYEIDAVLSYSSSMTDKESREIKGLPRGFRTNWHRFLFQDGTDSNGNIIYKYIDGEGYITAFFTNESTGLFHDSYGRGLVLDASSMTITDEQGNSLHFDTTGKLIRMHSAEDPFGDKVVEYNSDGLRKVYDQRDNSNYIKFSYEFSYLRYIRVYENDDLIKTYSLIGFPGQISSLEESVGSSTRTLYQFSVNDRDRVNRFIDCMTKDAYRMTYEFDDMIMEHRFSGLMSGYMSGSNFIEQSGVRLVEFIHGLPSCRQNQLYKELVVKDSLNVDTSYMIDADGVLVSVFERDRENFFKYRSLLKETGDCIPLEGYSNDYINGERSAIFRRFMSVDYDFSDWSALDMSAKICGYIKIRDGVRSAVLKASINGSSIGTVYLNHNAYGVWQRFELVFDVPLSRGGTTVDMSLERGDGYGINAEMCDVTIIKSDAKNRIFFRRLGDPKSLDDVEYLLLRKNDETYERVDLAGTGLYMTGGDYLRTMTWRQRHPTSDCVVFLCEGKQLRGFCGEFCGVCADGAIINFLNHNQVSNETIGDNKNWFIAKRIDSTDKLFYKFKEEFTEIFSRKEIVEEDVVSYEDVVSRYDLLGRIALERNKLGGEILYEYFFDGRFKSKTLSYIGSNGNIVSKVIYDTYLDSEGRNVYCVERSGVRTEFEYLGWLLKKATVIGGSGTEHEQEGISTEFTYDDFLCDISIVHFKCNGETQETHTYSRGSASYKTNYFSDGNTTISISKFIESRSSELSFYDGQRYVPSMLTSKTNSSFTETFDNSYAYGGGQHSLIQRLGNHRRVYDITYDGDSMVSFLYDHGVESEACDQLIRINDSFSGRDIDYEYFNDGDFSWIRHSNGFSIENRRGIAPVIRDHFPDGGIYYKLSKANDVWYCQTDGGEIPSASFRYHYDSLMRVTFKEAITLGQRCSHSFRYCQSDPFKPYEYSFGGGSYIERYSYDDFNRMVSREIDISYLHGEMEYSYDGLGRLASESNSVLGINNRQYVYSNGKMIAFGNNQITYDERGMLATFGNNFYDYDNYGNRVSRNGVIYQWERGRFLSMLGLTSFSYDYSGLRTSKTASDGSVHNYFYDKGKLVGEDIEKPGTVTKKLRFFYDRDGLSALRVTIGSETKDYIYLRNQMNDIVAIAEGSQLKAIYAYDAWGNHRVYHPDGSDVSQSDSLFVGNLNPFRYRSYYYDVETSLYYITSRYYDPEIGRFISPDSVDYLDPTTINGLNLYAYCNNDPVNNIDPTGHFIITGSAIFWAAIIGFAAGAVVGGAAGGISAATTGDNVGLGILFGAIGGGIMGAGAGIGATFIAPIIAGGSAVVAGHTLSVGAAWGIGLGIGFTSGAIGGGAQDFLNQMNSNEWNITKIDPMQMGWSALENGAFNTLSTVLGGFGGVDLSRSISFILGAQLNVIPSGYTLITDILRWYYSKRRQS